MSKPAGKQRPKPPPYPRPVPEFIIEELPPQAADIAWDALSGGGYYSEDGKDVVMDEHRAAKRRRIEACANSYWRGEPLYIMSAQLKGPFKDGWRNPWANKRKVQKMNGVVERTYHEIPETAARVPATAEEAMIVESTRELKARTLSVVPPPSPFTSNAQNLPIDWLPTLPKQAKEKRVQNWLKTNETYEPRSEILVHSSPTPSHRPHVTPRRSSTGQPEQQQASQSAPPVGFVPMKGNGKDTARSRLEDSFQPPQATRLVQQLSRNIQSIVTEPIAPVSDDLQAEVRRMTRTDSNHTSLLDSSRAEFAILKAKRSTLHTVPAIAHMSPFEFRKAGVASAGTDDSMNEEMEPGITGGEQNVSNSIDVEDLGSETRPLQLEITQRGPEHVEEEIFATAPQLRREPIQQMSTTNRTSNANVVATDSAERHPSHSALPLLLSTGVSEASTIDMPPSAQPRLEPQPSVSSLTRDEKMQSIKAVTVEVEQPADQMDVENDANMGIMKEQVIAHDTPNIAEEAVSHPEHHGCAAEALTTSTPRPIQPMAELNTQELLSNIEPLNLSTVKKPRDLAKKSSPSASAKARSDKKRKRASFAANFLSTSNHSSIKDSMKAKVSKTLGSPPVFILGKNDLDIDVSEEENDGQHKRPRGYSGGSNPKSILKSTNPAVSSISLRKSKSGISLGEGEGGQVGAMAPIGSGQNAAGEDQFDLDAAIDDLGSFLGTWDAEKEASSLDIEL